MKTVTAHVTILCWAVLDILQLPVTSGTRHRLCGKQLSDMLERVCHGGFYWPSVRKRNGDSLPDNLLPDGLEGYNVVEVLPAHKRGVADECCTSMCTTEQLRKYCAGDAADSRELASPVDNINRQFPDLDVNMGSQGDRFGSAADRLGTLSRSNRPMFFIPRGSSPGFSNSERRRKRVKSGHYI